MVSKVLICGIYWNWGRKQLRLPGVLIPIKVDGLEFYLTLIPHIWSGPCTPHPSKGLISSCLDKPLHPFVRRAFIKGNGEGILQIVRALPDAQSFKLQSVKEFLNFFLKFDKNNFFLLSKSPQNRVAFEGPDPHSKGRRCCGWLATRISSHVVIGSKNSRARGSSDPHNRTKKIGFAHRLCSRSRQPGNFAIFRYLWRSRNARDARDFVTEPRWFIIGLFFGGGRGCWKK